LREHAVDPRGQQHGRRQKEMQRVQSRAVSASNRSRVAWRQGITNFQPALCYPDFSVAYGDAKKG
jgi:hypothetical protein